MIARGLIVLLGGIVVYTAFRAQARNGGSALFFLALGFLLMTMGAAVAGTLFEFVGVNIFTALTAEAAFVISGLLAILYSLYGSRR